MLFQLRSRRGVFVTKEAYMMESTGFGKLYHEFYEAFSQLETIADGSKSDLA